MIKVKYHFFAHKKKNIKIPKVVVTGLTLSNLILYDNMTINVTSNLRKYLFFSKIKTIL